MGLRLQKRIKLGDGLTLNLGKRSASLSFGGRHERVTVGTHGAHASASLPGTGVSYRTGGGHHVNAKRRGGVLSMLLYAVMILWLIGVIAAQL